MAEHRQTLTVQEALDLAVQHHNSGRLSQAATIYNQILQSNPEQSNALHLLGVIAHQMGKNDVAVDLITKALAITPDFSEAHNNLGNALKGMGELDDAMTSYQKALALKPDYADAHYNLGLALHNLAKMEEAMASYQKALELKPDYAEARYNLGNVLKGMGELDDAVASYQKALALKPDHADAHYNLGLAFHNLGKLEEAMASYHKALELKPDYAEAHRNLGNVLRDVGKTDEAVDNYFQPGVFDVSNLEEAMRIILTSEAGFSPRERWEQETPLMGEMLAKRLSPSSNQTVIDYGSGVGRLAKQLIERTGCNVIGVDISRSMRVLSHMYCESDCYFSCSKNSLQTLIKGGLRANAAFSVWVLQHAENPERDIDLIYDALADDANFLVVNLNSRCLPTDQGWQDDGINVKQLIEHRFQVIQYFAVPEGAVTARELSFFGLYRKSPAGN